MAEALILSTLISLIFFGISVFFLKILKSKENPIQTLIIGFAIFVVCLNTPIRYFPIKEFAGAIPFILAGISLFLISKSKNWLSWRFYWHIYVMLVIGVAFRLWFATMNGVVTSIEPTTNHDDLYYIYTSSWLHDNAFNPPGESSDRAISYQHSAPINSMVLPRVGAESVTALMANILNLEIHVAYALLNAIGFLFLTLGILDIATKDISNTKESFVKYALILIIPNIGFIWANNNFPTLWGLVLVCGIQYQIHQFVKIPQKSEVIKVALLISALVCTYPELLTVVFFIFAFYIVFLKEVSFKNKVITVFSIGLVSILLVPFAYFDILRVASTTLTATGRSGGFSFDYFGLFTLPHKLMDYLSASSGFISTPWQYLMSLFFLLFMMNLSRYEFQDVIGLIAGVALLVAFMFLKNDAYGLMKAIEFSALPIAILVCRSIFNSAEAIYESKYKN